MPVSFKRPEDATFFKKTPTAELVPCPVCGGVNVMGKVAKKVDCTACSQTGYANYFLAVEVPVFYSSRAFTRWNATEGGLVKFGEAQIKLDSRYDDVVASTKYISLHGAEWNFQRVHEPGHTFGQDRIILALSRR